MKGIILSRDVGDVAWYYKAAQMGYIPVETGWFFYPEPPAKRTTMRVLWYFDGTRLWRIRMYFTKHANIDYAWSPSNCCSAPEPVRLALPESERKRIWGEPK
jgi:hypothetical protein